MLFGTGTVGEETGALKRDINAICSMRKVRRVTLRCHVNALAIHDDVIAVCFDSAWKRAMHTVALE